MPCLHKTKTSMVEQWIFSGSRQDALFYSKNTYFNLKTRNFLTCGQSFWEKYLPTQDLEPQMAGYVKTRFL